MRAALKAGWNEWRRGPWSRTNLPWTVGVVCLLAAMGLRVWSFRQARLSGEEAWFWTVGLDIAEGRAYPALGPPISGSRALLPGAATYWIIAATQLFGPSPLAAFAAFSLAGLAVTIPLALAVGRATDRETGLVFFVLTCFSPWWTVYTNSEWPGYLFPTLCGLLLVLLDRIVRRPSPVALAALAFVLIVGFQIHLSLIHYWLIALVVLIIARPAWHRRALVLGVGIGALCYVPYLVWELRHGFSNTIAIAHRSQGPGRSLVVLRDLVVYFVGFTTTDLTYLWNQGYWSLFDPARFWRERGVERTARFFATAGWAPIAWWSLGVTWLVTLASWVAFAPVAWRRLRADGRAPESLLIVACLTGLAGIPLFYALSGKGGYPHYVSSILPLAFIPPALFLGRLARHRIGRFAVVAYLATFAIGGFLGMRGYYAVDSRWSVPQSTAAVSFILERTKSPDGTQRPFELSFGFGPSWPQAYEAIARRVFHAPFTRASGADDVFRVDARDPARPVEATADVLVLPALIVTHQRRSVGARQP